jgi:hypothetical protein
MGAVYPFVVSLIAGFVSKEVLTAMAQRLVAIVGLSAVTYVGFHTAVSSIEAHLESSYGSLSSDVVELLGMLKVPNALSVVLSAYTSALVLKGLTAAGAITKVGVSTPGKAFSPGTF